MMLAFCNHDICVGQYIDGNLVGYRLSIRVCECKIHDNLVEVFRKYTKLAMLARKAFIKIVKLFQ